MNELALFAGAGGGILGGHLLGWRTVCAVEWEPYPASVLAARQNDGLLPAFPIWDDVRTFDGRPWRGIVDVVSGGFPCQDISAAGKGAGIDGERSGMWREMARIIGEVRPRFAFVENSPLLVGRGLIRVLADLAEMGFDARWGVVGAADVGAPHRRERCWVVAHAERAERRPELRACDRVEREREIGLPQRQEGTSRAGTCSETLADADSMRELQPEGRERTERGWVGNGGENVANTNSERQQELHAAAIASEARQHPWGIVAGWREGWWGAEPDVGRVADGVAARVDRLKAIGNGQVPQCAAEAWRILMHNM
ncbi:DNA cytosine methyltransferase [Sulfuriferula sp.]|uniref:DNA cytosine methyltransferase n=1 Tax=Sulfuriferula sp. TaxID=2025307 RepID=UPI003521231D